MFGLVFFLSYTSGHLGSGKVLLVFLEMWWGKILSNVKNIKEHIITNAVGFLGSQDPVLLPPTKVNLGHAWKGVRANMNFPLRETFNAITHLR